MPYVNPKLREALRPWSAMIASEPGYLNYQFTFLINQFLSMRRTVGTINNYQDFNDVIGALEGAKAEFYRRIVIPYEDTKAKEHGDVY